MTSSNTVLTPAISPPPPPPPPSHTHTHTVLEGFEIPHPNHQFKSSKTMDQRLLMQKNAPAALLEQYGQAQPPPALGQFDKDWEEVRNASHLYSNPNFFFENWRDEIQRQTLRKISHMDLLSVSPVSMSSVMICTLGSMLAMSINPPVEHFWNFKEEGNTRVKEERLSRDGEGKS